MMNRGARARSFSAVLALLGACGGVETASVADVPPARDDGADASIAEDRPALADATHQPDVAADAPAPPDVRVAMDVPAAQDVALTPDRPEVDAANPDAGADADVPRSFRASYSLSARFTEGGTYDPATHSFFVGSLADGTVHRVDAETGAQRLLFRESAAGTWWTLGMDVHVARRRLAVCAMDDRRARGDSAHPYDGFVWVFDLDTGARVARHALADAFGTATCTDVAYAADGTLYVCDREHPMIYRVDTAGVVTTFIADSLLSGSVVGQNALVMLPDQSALLSLIYLPSRIVRVGIRDRNVANVSLRGSFFDGLPPLSGADGMTLSGTDLLVAFTSQVTRVRPSLGDWSAASTATVDVPSGMTDIVHTPGGDYLLNGQSLVFALGATPDPSRLVRFVGSF